MKSIRSFFSVIGILISYIFPPRVIHLIRYLTNGLKSGYVKGGFKQCGKNFNIDYPFHYRGLNHIIIGDNFTSFARLRLEAYEKHNGHTYSPEILVGNNVSINYDCHIGCLNKIIIGNGVLIASRVFITDHYHGNIDLENLQIAPSKRKIVSPGPVVIEDNVWIGEGVAIMPNLTIGKNSIIGANAVVTKSFGPNSIIAGVPAKLIKYL